MAFELFKRQLRHDNKNLEVAVTISTGGIVSFSKAATDEFNANRNDYISIYTDEERKAIAVLFHAEKVDYCRKVSWDGNTKHMRLKIATAFKAIKTQFKESQKFKPYVDGGLVVIWQKQ